MPTLPGLLNLPHFMWHFTVAFQYQASQYGMPRDCRAHQRGHTNAVTPILVSGNPSSGLMHTPSDTSMCVYLCPMAPSPVCAQHRSWIGVCILCGILLPLCANMAGPPICFGGRARLLTPPIGGRDGASCHLSGWPPSLLQPRCPWLFLEHARL